MEGALLLYGANGYTGKLIAQAACRAGISLILGGRDARKLQPLASQLGVEFRTTVLEDEPGVDRALAGVRVLLNAAGPFQLTAPPLIEACIRERVHYLDITGETEVIAAASRYHRDARHRDVMIMPAVGFDVVPSDCLAYHVACRAEKPKRLFIGLSGLDLMTRGSAKTIVLQIGRPVWVRRGGTLTRVPPGAVQRAFDYGSGRRLSIAVNWGDVVSSHFTTGIPDITVYSEATPAVQMHHALVQSFGWAIPLAPWRELLSAGTEWIPEGPTALERQQRQTVIVAEVESADGRTFGSRMRTPDAYSMTALTATAVACSVLRGDFETGFQTPARVYGADFPLSLAGVQREDI